MSTTDTAAAESAVTGFERPMLPVVLTGIGTTILTLILLFLLNVFTDINIMGWYIKLIAPIGAICVGALAASGYGLAS